MDVFWQLTATGLANGIIYALVAIGFVIIYKASDVINFAQGSLLMAGAYLGYAFLALDLHPVLALALTLVACALLGVVVALAVLRPLIGEPVISMIMATVALSSVLHAMVQGVWGSRPRSLPLSVDITVLIAVAAATVCLVGWFFRRSREGLAMRAVADDQQAAMSVGVSLPRTLAIAWALASASAGLGGTLLASLVGVSRDVAVVGLRVFPVVILGGLDSMIGAVVGAAIIGLLESYTGGYIGSGFQRVVPFVVLIAILMVRPYGLFGKERMERV